MTDTVLSPAFDKARDISQFLAVLFRIGFWMTLLYLAAVAVLMVVPLADHIGWEGHAVVPLAGHPLRVRILGAWSLAVGVLPGLLALFHAGRLFDCFARGEVFGAAPVHHIRQAGLYLMISAVASWFAQLGLHLATGEMLDFDINVQTAIFGAATYVAAYVMAEARRIADDNAGIL